MSDNALKLPLQSSLNLFAAARTQDRAHLDGKSLPCTVTKVVSSGIVQVNFAVTNEPWTLPQITVPVMAPEYVRYPIQVGDKGLCVSADALLGGLTGLGSGPADLTVKPSNLSALAFIWLGNSSWSAPTDPNAIELHGVGSSGVILHDGGNTVIVTVAGGGITIATNGMPVTVNGGGTVTVNGGGDVVAGTISLLNHKHSGVTTGAGDTGPPV